MTIEELSSLLAHPFFLLITGALISSGLVTILTQKWQNKKRQFEVKVSLINQVSESSTLLLGALMLRTDKKLNREKEENAIMRSKQLETNLYAHFPKSTLADEWRDYVDTCQILWIVYSFVLAKKNNEKFEEYLTIVKDYFTTTFPSIQIEWDKIRKDFDTSEFLTVRSELFNHYRFFVEKISTSKATIF